MILPLRSTLIGSVGDQCGVATTFEPSYDVLNSSELQDFSQLTVSPLYVFDSSYFIEFTP